MSEGELYAAKTFLTQSRVECQSTQSPTINDPVSAIVANNVPNATLRVRFSNNRLNYLLRDDRNSRFVSQVDCYN